MAVTAQKVDSIYLHLYTDSLKKATYNYINIDGKLKNGRFIPLDSSDIIFKASDGKFHGNSLWIGPEFNKEKVTITVTLKSNKKQTKTFDMYIKQAPDPDLPTQSDLDYDTRRARKRKLVERD